MLQHNPEDQSLDERFILDALGDIRSQRQKLEAQIIEHKAYGLHEKLEKLSFVQDFLPKIFSNVQGRIYPKITLWDEDAVNETLLRFYNFLEPGRGAIAVKASGTSSLKRNSKMPRFRPQLDLMPIVLWSAYVGIQAWRNKPIISGGSVYVASSGENWHSPDRLDGVLCLDLETGSQLWHAQTHGDANEMLLAKGLLVVGSDEGQLLAVKAQSGEPIWSANLSFPIVCGPIRLPLKHMSSQGRRLSDSEEASRLIENQGLVVLSNGEICIFDLDNGGVKERRKLGHSVIGKAKIFLSQGNDSVSIFVPHVGGFLTEIRYSLTSSDEGSILELALQEVSMRGQIRSVDLSPYFHIDNKGYSIEVLEAVSVVDAGDRVLVGVARDTYANEIPLVALDRKTLDPKWSKQNSYRTFGNLRSEPLVLGDCAVLAPAYCDGLVFVSLKTGQIEHELSLGGRLFEQWSSPVNNEQSIYLGRIDGFFHKVDAKRKNWIGQFI